MSYGDFQDAKQRVREAVDIVEVIGAYHPLRRQGRDYVTLCPWHNDSRPSLRINQARQTWKCWVCDIGGDVFSFVMKQENLGFRETLEMLAEKAGIELPSHQRAAKSVVGSPSDKKTLLEAAAWAEAQFFDFLASSPDAENARQYVRERGISQESVDTFRIGYSPDSWDWLLERAKGTRFSPAVLNAAGVVGKSDKSGKYYDQFRGRLIFPIRDAQSRPIAFGGRILPMYAEQSPAKYLNSTETLIFSKSDTIYGLDIARNHTKLEATAVRELVVMEGYTDVVMAHQFGLKNAVAILGTALNSRHIRVLKRFADRVTLVLDGDEAGQRRTNQVLDLFVAERVDMRVLTLPEEFDPCEFFLERGGSPFRAMLNQAVDALEHKLATVTRGIDLQRDSHLANQALEAMLTTLANVSYEVTDSAARMREQQMLSRLARMFLLPDEEVRARFIAIRTSEKRMSEVPHVEPPSMPSRKVRLSEIPNRQAEVLEMLCVHPDLVAEIVADIPVEMMTHEVGRDVFQLFDRLNADGEHVSFDRVMCATDDPVLQNLLIDLEERASLKESQAIEPARTRLARLKDGFQFEIVEQARRKDQLRLEAKSFDQDEEQAVFESLLAQQRAKHGVSRPTDG